MNTKLFAINDLKEHGCELVHNSQNLDLIQCFKITAAHCATQEHLAFIKTYRYLKRMQNLYAALIITDRSLVNTLTTFYHGAIMIHDDLETLMVTLLSQIEVPKHTQTTQIHPTAIIHPTVEIGSSCVIGAYSQIGEQCILGAHTVIGHNVRIDAHCQIGAHCVIHDRCIIEESCQLEAHAVIGSAGFGYIRDKNLKIPHLGAVWLGKHVAVGASTTIDRSTFPETYTQIGAFTKIDNLVQIGHNVQIGEYCLICAQTGISGSAILEDHIVCAGQVGIANDCHIEQGTVLMARAGISKNLKKDVYIGYLPAKPYTQYKKEQKALLKLLQHCTHTQDKTIDS